MDIQIPFPKIVVAVKLDVLHHPCAVRLDGYPHLAYAPAHWGPEVRTEDVGAKVSDLIVAFAETPDPAAVAARFGTTASHVGEAVRYAVECGAAAAIAPEG